MEKEDGWYFYSNGAECIRNQKYEADRVERTLIEQWKTRRLWLLVSVLWHTCMHEQYDPGGCIRAKTRLKLVAQKEGSQLCKTTEKWNAYKAKENWCWVSANIAKKIRVGRLVINFIFFINFICNFMRTLVGMLIFILFHKVSSKLFNDQHFCSPQSVVLQFYRYIVLSALYQQICQ